jgi:serine/threonine protein kinase
MSKLGEMLGEGSFGKVYRLGKDKVVKYIHLYLDGLNDYIEPYILSRIDHPNIMRSDEISFGEGLLKILLDLGTPISSLPEGQIKKDKNNLSIHIKNGLTFLHSQGIVHGDIKPSNILKVGGSYKINDFGLSILLRSDPQDIDNMIYSVNYRPPEISGWIVSRKSDIWAFGKLLENYFTSREMIKKGFKDFLRMRLEDRPFFSDIAIFLTDEQISQNNKHLLDSVRVNKNWNKIFCQKLRNDGKNNYKLSKKYLQFEKSLIKNGVMNINIK